jgi:hypothetical protein
LSLPRITLDARTLREVLAFYSRGGSVAPIAALDGTPISPLGVPAATMATADTAAIERGTRHPGSGSSPKGERATRR